MNQDIRSWISSIIGAAIAASIAAADAFHFGKLGTGVDLLLVVAGLGVLGVHVMTSNIAAQINKGA
jgi:hypothetical protein